MNVLAANAWLLVGGMAAAAAMFLLLWRLHRAIRNAGIVDIGWSAGVGTLGAAAAVLGTGWGPRRALVGAMIGLWAARLVFYILRDRILPGEEDGRYRRMRAYWGEKADLYFLPFFVGQCVLVPLFVMPLLPAFADTRAGWRATDVLGALLWIAALAGETLTDRQLARFRADPVNRGRTCRLGLWRYSRHPNYFCEWLHWWSYVLVGATAAGGWLTLVGPAAMYAFLMWLTGIPHTEKQALSKRGDDYRDYQRTTNMFFPWFPKRSGHADAAD